MIRKCSFVTSAWHDVLMNYTRIPIYDNDDVIELYNLLANIEGEQTSDDGRDGESSRDWWDGGDEVRRFFTVKCIVWLNDEESSFE